jgi:hypothetical protein
MTRRLEGCVRVDTLRDGDDDGFYGFRFCRDDGRCVWVLWSDKKPVTVSLLKETGGVALRGIRIYDHMGKQRDLTDAERHAGCLELSSAPVYLEQL